MNTDEGLHERFATHFIPLLCSSLAFVCLVAFLRNRIPNLALYAVASLLFFAVYLLGCRAVQLARDPIAIPVPPLPLPNVWKAWTSEVWGVRFELLTVVLAAGVLLMHFIREGMPDRGSDFNESLFRYQIPRWSYLLLLAACTAVSYALARLLGKSRFLNQGKRRPLARLLISLPYICLLSCTVWVPNIFYSLHTFYHAHAYCSSICDVLNLAPLGELDKPFYGHYSLFFLLPCRLMHLFGVPYNICIATVVAACALVTLLSTLYVVNRFVRNDGAFLLLILALGDPFLMMMPKLHFIKDVYLQMIPHRVMFPALISACMVAFSDGPLGRGRAAVLYLLAALSLVWSPEIGLVCIASASLYVFVRRIAFADPLSSGNVRLLLACGLLALLAVLTAYLIVLAYDLLTGGGFLPFKDFMYPVMGEFKSIAVRGPLPDLFRPWISVLLFFLCGVAVCAWRVLKAADGGGRPGSLLCISVMALGLFAYYLDSGLQVRLMIVFFQFIMVFAPLLDWLLSEERQLLPARALSLVALAVVSGFVLGNAGMKEVLTDRRATAWKARDLGAFARTLDADIPEGTLAFGWGVPDLYAVMGRDPGVHVIDWVDIAQDPNPAYLRHVNALVEQVDSFFSYQESVPLLPAGAEFDIAKEYEYMGWKFALYNRRK